jgi:hypothetical protein
MGLTLAAIVVQERKSLVPLVSFSFCYCLSFIKFIVTPFPFLHTCSYAHKQPRCRAAYRPIFTGYGKLILSNAILHRGYPPIPTDTVQVSFDDPQHKSIHTTGTIKLQKFIQPSSSHSFTFFLKLLKKNRIKKSLLLCFRRRVT